VSKTPKGFSYVAFADPAHAIAAYEALDRRSFQGRLLHILAAVDKNPRHDAAEDDGKSEGRKTIKAQKGEERKKASGKEFNWAMLYMNVSAVVSFCVP
jgi:multiple RNA-binding domain-containing protein 1